MQQNNNTNENTFLDTITKQLLTLYKTFVRPHLDYADRIYDKPCNGTLKKT